MEYDETYPKKGTTSTPEERLQALELWKSGVRIRDIGLRLQRGGATISKWLRDQGIDTQARKRGVDFTRRGAQDASLPIGSLPPTSPFHELDREMALAKRAAGLRLVKVKTPDGDKFVWQPLARPMMTANPWPSQSSLV